MAKKKEYKPTLLLDFDGVIHSYKSGWVGATEIPDPPVAHEWKSKGTVKSHSSIEWVTSLVKSGKFLVCVYSSRSKSRGGIKAMQEWFLRFGMSKDVLKQIDFPKQKPAAFLTIDDRAITFDGSFPTADKLIRFKTWQGK